MADSRPVSSFRSTDCPRRAVLRGAAGLVLAWLTPVRSDAAQEDGPPPVAGDLLVRVGDDALIPLAPDDVPFDGRALMAWAIGPAADAPKNAKLNKIIVARLNPAMMADGTRQRAADDIVAYSAVCTHAGCDVDEGLGSNESIFCSCHGSAFDARMAVRISAAGQSPAGGAAAEAAGRPADRGRAVHDDAGLRPGVGQLFRARSCSPDRTIEHPLERLQEGDQRLPSSADRPSPNGWPLTGRGWPGGYVQPVGT